MKLGFKALTVEIQLPDDDTMKGDVRGLLGVWDDDKTNDFLMRNGTTLPASSTDRQKFDFGNSCK